MDGSVFRVSAEDEANVGIELFLTDTNGIGGKLRASAEDFVVREVSRPPKERNGPFTIATVTSTNWETNRLIDAISKQLHISRNAVGFAGTKDKRAVTTQLMSFKAPQERVDGISLGDVQVEGTYSAANPLQLGRLLGNEFEITVSDISMSTVRGLRRMLDDTIDQLRDYDGAPNYFGIQRFGTLRPCTHLVGRCIADGDLDEAVMTYLTSPAVTEQDDLLELRSRLRKDRDWHRALEELPTALNFERAMLQHLVEKPDDFAGALLRLPRNLLLMFVHAYQSFLFNRTLSERMRSGLPLTEPVVGDVVLPADKNGLPRQKDPIAVTASNIGATSRQVKAGRAFVSAPAFGYDTPMAKGDPGEVEQRILEEEGVKPKDFRIGQIPRISAAGVRREILMPVFPLKYELPDESDPTRVTLRFRLNRGCYATTLLREFLKAPVMSY